MHFAMPPRKTSHPPPYNRSTRLSLPRRRQLQFGILICAVVTLVLYLSMRGGSSSSGSISSRMESIPYGTPPVIIVTVLDEETMSAGYRKKIVDNRNQYAEQHGYATFFPNASDYELLNSPRSWAMIPGMRHAMTTHPHSTYFFSLSPHALIMDFSVDIESHITSKKKLEEIMLREKPVVPPDSVIRTFSHLKGDKVDFIVSQDSEGLCQGSYILRQGDWSRFFLDTWFDPLYRSYNFQKAEGHALEHIVQWHPTILAKLALIPFKNLNSYNVDISGRGGKERMYKPGDFTVRLVNCDVDPTRSCETEFDLMLKQQGTKS